MNETKIKKILIVEDDQDLRAILKNGLSKFNYLLFEAEDGEQAVRLAHENEPDLMLLDLLLPKMDGFAVLENIRKNANPAVANVPVIVLSNLWSNKDILRIRALKIEEYYVKANTNLSDVYSKIQEVLGK